MEADAEMEAAEVEMEADAERKSYGDGEYEAGKKTPMRRLRGSVEDSDAEVAERQKRMKETDADSDDKERGGGGGVREGEEVVKPDLEEIQRGYAMYLEWKRRNEQQERVRVRDPDEAADPYAFEAKMFKKRWDSLYLDDYGSIDKTTEISCMRFTHNPAPQGGMASDTLQVFYVKVKKISGGLQWPLEVFGMVALRDSMDYNRNIIFERERDNCQILTDEDPYLALTGPVRAVMLYDPVIFEATLYVKGATRSEDKELSLLATSLGALSPCLHSRLVRNSYRSRLSTLELMLAQITRSVEATISVRVTSGSWPDGFCCRFVASTNSIGQSIVLLETADDQVPITGDEVILARQVVSVESDGNLTVLASIKNGGVVYTDGKDFKPLEMGASSKDLRLGCCMLEVTVYWSCFWC